jgi:hypothetical protein
LTTNPGSPPTSSARSDLGAVLVYALVAIAATARNKARLVVALAAVPALLLTLWSYTPMTPVDYVERAPRLLLDRNPAWALLTMAAVMLTLFLALQDVLRGVPPSKAGAEDGRRASSLRTALGTALAALSLVPWLLGDGGIPWMSHGGSAIVAAFALLGLLARRDVRGVPLGA